MRRFALLAALTLTLESGAGRARNELPSAQPNPNTSAAGELRDGVLSLTLDAMLTMWHPDGDSLPGIAIEAFAEAGRTPQVPGPLIRVPQGTELRVTVRNSLPRDTLTYYFHAGDAVDSILVAPGLTRELLVRPVRAGTFLYRATTSTLLGRALRVSGLLAGGVVIDSAGTVGTPRDRVFVINVAADAMIANTGFPLPERSVWAINGLSWPHTERFRVMVGDTLRWRFINATNDQHPMHLHGFYYRVDGFDGPAAAVEAQGPLGRRVVTERLAQFTTMSMSWVPERAGNWLFHCHFQEHVVPHGPFGVVSPSGESQRIAPSPSLVAGVHQSHGNHALTGMGGLVLGIETRPLRGQRIAEPSRGQRQLRLLAVQDSQFPDSTPSLRFVLEDPHGHGGRVDAVLGISPTIYLTRGEPVSIMVVNRMREATAVHWHGIELESYFDGVAGFGGFGRRIAPIIAPRDSFEARFTPPRAGTFICHSHVDEPRQHSAGLVGALVVRDSAPSDSSEEQIVLLKSARVRNARVSFEINGKTDPDTLVLRAGRKYRLRIIAIQRALPAAIVSITSRPDSSFAMPRDTLIVRWRPLAKDGMDLPERSKVPRLARHTMGMGETNDFEFIPERPGHLRLEVRSAIRLLVRAPIVVR